MFDIYSERKRAYLKTPFSSFRFHVLFLTKTQHYYIISPDFDQICSSSMHLPINDLNVQPACIYRAKTNESFHINNPTTKKKFNSSEINLISHFFDQEKAF